MVMLRGGQPYIAGTHIHTGIHIKYFKPLKQVHWVERDTKIEHHETIFLQEY